MHLYHVLFVSIIYYGIVLKNKILSELVQLHTNLSDNLFQSDIP
jgi:hypothetical protein